MESYSTQIIVKLRESIFDARSLSPIFFFNLFQSLTYKTFFLKNQYKQRSVRIVSGLQYSSSTHAWCSSQVYLIPFI